MNTTVLNDHQLQQALAKLAPTRIRAVGPRGHTPMFEWRLNERAPSLVLSTEWLHICWLIEREIEGWKLKAFRNLLEAVLADQGIPSEWITHASWQHRATALCKLEGVTP